MSQISRVELFKFVEQNRTFTQCRGNKAVVYQGETYEPYALGRSNIDIKTDLARASIDVTMAFDNPIAQYCLAGLEESVLTLTIFQQLNSTFATIWKGRYAKHRASNKQVVVAFESIFTSLRRPGLRRRFSRTCPYALYGRGCNLNPEDFETLGEITEVDGALIRVPQAATEDNGFWIGGFVKGAHNIRRMIIAHDGEYLTLSRPVPAFALGLVDSGFDENFGDFFDNGSEVRLYPGCDHSDGANGCLKFSNLPNYGGFRYIPTKNPFGGSSII